jgi:hypothetical protein
MKSLDMRTFSDQLLYGLKAELKKISEEKLDELTVESKSIVVARVSLVALKDYVHKYTFKDGKEEIEFFKTVKPLFASQYYYHNQLFDLLLNQPTGDTAALQNYYRVAVNNLAKDRTVNRDFYQYCLSGSSHFDETYFRRRPNAVNSLDVDTAFTTEFDGVLSRLLALRLLEEYLLKKLNDVIVNPTSPSVLTWTGTKSALIELIYALESAEVINKGKSDIREIATSFERLFQISLGNYYRQFQDIRLRKTGKTNFLDDLKLSLEQRMDELEQ